MRPLWFEFPQAKSLFATDDQFMLGPALLVAPVLEENAKSRSVALPAGPVWYDAATGASLGDAASDSPAAASPVAGESYAPRVEEEPLVLCLTYTNKATVHVLQTPCADRVQHIAMIASIQACCDWLVILGYVSIAR